jgi:hypothetical protein
MMGRQTVDQSQLFYHEMSQMTKPTHRPTGHVFAVDHDDALADILREVADPLQIVGDAQDPKNLPQIDGHRLAPRDCLDGLFFDSALDTINCRVHINNPVGAPAIPGCQRLDDFRDLSFRKPSHLRQCSGKFLQIGVEGFRRMFGPSHLSGGSHAASASIDKNVNLQWEGDFAMTVAGAISC